MTKPTFVLTCKDGVIGVAETEYDKNQFIAELRQSDYFKNMEIEVIECVPFTKLRLKK